MIADVLSRVLGECGHTVDIAEDGESVVRDRNLTRFDLIILDMKMPGIGGAEIYSHIHKVWDEKTPGVLFITGDGTNLTTLDFINRTGDPMLTKPFTLESLYAAVDQFA